MSHPLASIKTRFGGFLCLSLAATLAFQAWDAWAVARESVLSRERARIIALVSTLAPQISGDAHEAAARGLAGGQRIDDWTDAPDPIQRLRRPLVDAPGVLAPDRPLQTLRLLPEHRADVEERPDAVHVGALQRVLSAAEVPRPSAFHDYVPTMAPALFAGQLATVEHRSGDDGEWLHAFAPLRRSDGEVVGLLAVAAELDGPLAIASAEALRRSALFGGALLIVLLGSLAFTVHLGRAIARLESAGLRLASGDHGTPIRSGKYPELRGVARAFEGVRAELEDRAAEEDRLRGDLELTRLEAEAAVRAKSTFLAKMSHELRTPLNAIVGFAGLLREGTLPDEQREMAETVHRAGLGLHAFVSDILDYSTAWAGELDLADVEFEVREVLAEVADLLRAEAARGGLDLRWTCAADVPHQLRGDPARLRQVLLNLVSNALKFTESGRVAFSASLLFSDGASSVLRFEVEDTGVGIAADVQPRLFEPFSLVDDSTTRALGGTGLGLAICKQLAEFMGGQIGVQSTLGRGTTFWFTAVLRHRQAAPGEPWPPAPLPRRPANGRARPEAPPRGRVLVVEDSPVNRRMALHMVRKLGFEGEVAVDGAEAVDAMRFQEFDLVLMDCGLPDIDGYEATERIRSFGGRALSTPIVAFTAHASERDRKRIAAAGMDDQLSKPVALDELEAILTKWCPARGTHVGRPVTI